MDDHWSYRPPVPEGTRTITNDQRSDFYNVNEVDILRAKPRTRRVGYIVDKATGKRWEVAEGAPFNEVTQEQHLRNVPDLEAQARADAIIAAWDGHQEACEACEAFPAYARCLDAEVAYFGGPRVRQGLGDAISPRRARPPCPALPPHQDLSRPAGQRRRLGAWRLL